MKLRKNMALVLTIALLISLLPSMILAADAEERSLALTEDWRLTSELDLDVPEGTVLTIDGKNKYYIYEFGGSLKNRGSGFVVLKNTILYPAGGTPETGSIAELIAEASRVTNISAPAKDATALTLPQISGYSVNIKSSSNIGVIALDGVVAPPTQTTTVNLVLALTGNGGIAYTQPISVSVPASSSSGSAGGSSGGGGGVPTTEQAPSVKFSGGGTATITVDKDSDNASINLSVKQGGLFGSDGTAIVTVPSLPGVSSYTFGIPADSLSDSTGNNTLILNTGQGSLSLPSNMLSNISGVMGKNAEIIIEQGDTSKLLDSLIKAIGNRPLIQLSLYLNGEQVEWNNQDAPVIVSIPYIPTEEEKINPEGIVTWYIDGKGNAVCVPNGYYDSALGVVTFSTTHFSDYAVAYNKVLFSDISDTSWYSKAISFIAARDITTGTGNGNFSPDAKLTRGQFLVMLMKAYNLTPDVEISDNFSDAGNTYYTEYLAKAKRMSISQGVGNNMFSPEKEITRQEMFALLYNMLNNLDELPQGSSGKALSTFSDADQIAFWAKDAIELLSETGIITGSDGRLSPLKTTTRAEMAQMIYNLLNQ